LFEEPGESAHLCSFVIGIEHVNDYTLIRIRIVAADSIRTKISNLQVPNVDVLYMNIEHMKCVDAATYCVDVGGVGT